jgi:NADPH:quinone reductase
MAFAQILLDVRTIFAPRPAVGVAWGEYLNTVPGSAALFSWGLSQLVFLGLESPRRNAIRCRKPRRQCLADGGVLGS